MNNVIVRIESVSIHNFKNIVNGSIDLTNKKKGFKASILGLYGQNGSGKTALIDAIQLLQYTLQGRKVPSAFADCIYVESQHARLSFSFWVNNSIGTYHATYSF
ncbi:MAG: AAA family ATPase, partial [Clostridia bacterium]|nr:AAA family ATPase [Clostridia bacterium]